MLASISSMFLRPQKVSSPGSGRFDGKSPEPDGSPSWRAPVNAKARPIGAATSSATSAQRGSVLRAHERPDKDRQAQREYALARSRAARDDRYFDGAVLGADGKAYSSATSIGDVPAVLPSTDAHDGHANGKVIYINGQNTPVYVQLAVMERLANSMDAAVVGIHASTRPHRIQDGLQSVRDKLNVSTAPSEVLRRELFEHLTRPETRHLPFNIVAHSRGAIITSHAMKDLTRDLAEHLRREQPMFSKAVACERARRLMGNIHVETIGGAAYRFPQSRADVHRIINSKDLVAKTAGGDLPARKLPAMRYRSSQDRVTRFAEATRPHAAATYLQHVSRMDAKTGSFATRASSAPVPRSGSEQV